MPPIPDPEVRPAVERRAWTAAEKLRILRAAEACRPGSPERDALLRREGIYSSHLSKWRRQRDPDSADRLAAHPVPFWCEASFVTVGRVPNTRMETAG